MTREQGQAVPLLPTLSFCAWEMLLLTFLKVTSQVCSMVLQWSLLREPVKNVRGLHCGSHGFDQEAKPEKPSWLHLAWPFCHLPLQKGKGKRVGEKGLWTSERVIFIWNMTGTFYLGKGKEKCISYKTGFIKRFELVIAVTQDQGLNSDHSCLNAALKLSWRSWILLVKKRAQDLSVALKPNDREDFAFIKLNTLPQGLHAYQSLLSHESYSGICGDPTCESGAAACSVCRYVCVLTYQLCKWQSWPTPASNSTECTPKCCVQPSR